MKNLWTTIYVNDMNASLEFYTNVLSLPVKSQMVIDKDHVIAHLGAGETNFELVYDKSRSNINFSGHVSTGFSVDSLEVCMDILEKNNVPIVAGPIQPNDFVKFIFIHDPNGYKIQLVEIKQ